MAMGSHQHITAPARKALLEWFLKHRTPSTAVETQMLEDMCLGDLSDLGNYVRERYGVDAEARLSAGIESGSRWPLELLGVVSNHEAAAKKSQTDLSPSSDG